MKKIILIFSIFLTINLYAYSFSDALIQEQKGNLKIASELYLKLCDDVNIDACYNLGVMYVNGDGVRQNKNSAKEFFGKACDYGNNKGCKQFRLMSDTGIK